MHRKIVRCKNEIACTFLLLSYGYYSREKKFDLTRSYNLFTPDITRSDWLWLDLARYNQI